jgi:MFS family permease
MVAALLWVMAAREMWMFYLFAVIFGIGYGGLAALMSPVPAELFGLQSLGAVVGAVVCSFTIGGAIGPVLAGRIFDLTGSYSLAFWACTAAGVAGIILSALLKLPISQQGAGVTGSST